MYRKLAMPVVVVLSLFASAPAMADRAFAPRFTTNDTGDVQIVGNQLLNCDVTVVASCASARIGTATPPNQNNNNAQEMEPVDTDGDPATTLDSSTAGLTIPAGGRVLFAGLYWTGNLASGDVIPGGPAPTPAPAPADDDLVKFKTPGGAYSTLTADQLDLGSGGLSTKYVGFKDVTSIVAAAGSGTYAAGDAQTATGGGRQAGWTLVVVVRDPAEPLRNLTVFDGLATIVTVGTPVTIGLSGLRTPPLGDVRTDVGSVAWEGDLGILGDQATLDGTALSDAANPATNFFDASISRFGTLDADRDPSQRNTFGLDADVLHADGLMPNDATSATIAITTSGDSFLTSVFTLATQLYAPALSPVAGVADLTDPGAQAQPGDRLRYTVALDNAGQDAATGVRVDDAIPARTTYAPGSLRVADGPGGPLAATDAAGDDTAEFDAVSNRVRFRLGSGASPTRGGTLAAGGAAGAATTLSFDVIVDPGAAGATIDDVASADLLGATSGVPFSEDSTVARIGVLADATVPPPPPAPAPPIVAGGRTTLALHARSNPARVRGGQRLDYAATIRNVGRATARQVKVCDRLPAHITYLSARHGALRSGAVCWTIATIAAGSSTRVAVLVRTAPRRTPARIRNTMSATATNAAGVRAVATTMVLRSAIDKRRGTRFTG